MSLDSTISSDIEDEWILVDQEGLRDNYPTDFHKKLALGKIQNVDSIIVSFHNNHTATISVGPDKRFNGGRHSLKPPTEVTFHNKRAYEDFVNSFPKDLQYIHSHKEMEKVDDPIGSCLDLARHVHATWETKPFQFCFRKSGHDGKKFKELMSRCLSEHYTHFKVWGDDLSHDEMDFLMDTVDPSKSVSICAKVPKDWQNEKAFQFRSSRYSYAKWVTAEHLKSIKNIKAVHLAKTCLVNEDLNTFFHHWVENKEDMSRFFTVHLKSGLETDEEVIMKGLEYIEKEDEALYPKPLQTVLYIKCRDTQHRKYPVGRLEIFPGHVIFNSLDPSKCEDVYQELKDLEDRFEIVE